MASSGCNIVTVCYYPLCSNTLLSLCQTEKNQWISRLRPIVAWNLNLASHQSRIPCMTSWMTLHDSSVMSESETYFCHALVKPVAIEFGMAETRHLSFSWDLHVTSHSLYITNFKWFFLSHFSFPLRTLCSVDLILVCYSVSQVLILKPNNIVKFCKNVPSLSHSVLSLTLL